MGGEDGGDVDAALLAEWNSDTCQPLVELDNDGTFLLVVDILEEMLGSKPMAMLEGISAHLAQEPCNEVTEDDSFVCLMVIRRAGNAGG